MNKILGALVLVAACGGSKPAPPQPPVEPEKPADPVVTDQQPVEKPVEPKEPPPPDTGGYALVKSDGLKWSLLDPKNDKGPEIAIVHGDLQKGGAFFLRLPAGMKPPLHTHTVDYHAVVVSGAPKHWIAGAEGRAKPLAAGSHWFQPGGQPHGDQCTGKEPCVLFIIQNGAFDFQPAAKTTPVKPDKYRQTARKDAKFKPLDPKQPKGLKAAFVFGDPKTGPVGYIIEVPAGANGGLHAHTSSYHALVLEGAPAHWLPHESGEGDPLAAGAYWWQPGGYDHGDRCTSTTPCRAFVYMDKAMDMLPAKTKK